MRRLLAESGKAQGTTAADHHPARPAPGRRGDRRREGVQGFGDRLLIEDLSFRLPPGGIVGVIGPNGAGKTTLFRMITGQEKPDAGTFKVGDTVKLGYVDQTPRHAGAEQDGVGGNLRRPGR